MGRTTPCPSEACDPMNDAAAMRRHSNGAVPMQSSHSQAVVPPPLQSDTGGMQNGCTGAAILRTDESPFMTTTEAAAYLRKSISWVLRVPDLPFLRGKPNLYVRADLDAWIEKHKFRPRLKS